MPLTLLEEIERIRALYSARNARTLDTPDKLVALLGSGVRLLEDAFEEDAADTYAKCLASIFSRWAACTLHFEGVVDAMASKYASNCAYCSTAPCTCPKVGRPAEKKLMLNPAALEWSLQDWQQHLVKLYGARNRERGMNVALRRLFSELTEVSNELLFSQLPMSGSFSAATGDTRSNIRNELCDVLAWTLACADILNINLMEAVEVRYGRGCPVCKQSPCDCNVGQHHGIRARTQNASS